jgi:hypothetical protein
VLLTIIVTKFVLPTRDQTGHPQQPVRVLARRIEQADDSVLSVLGFGLLFLAAALLPAVLPAFYVAAGCLILLRWSRVSAGLTASPFDARTIGPFVMMFASVHALILYLYQLNSVQAAIGNTTAVTLGLPKLIDATSTSRDIYAFNLNSTAWTPWAHLAAVLVLVVYNGQLGSTNPVGSWRHWSKRWRDHHHGENGRATPLRPIGEEDELEGEEVEKVQTTKLGMMYSWVVQWCIRYSPYACLAAITFWAVLLPTWPALVLLLWAHVHWILPFRIYVKSIRYLIMYTIVLIAFDYLMCIGSWSDDVPDQWTRVVDDETLQFGELGARILVLFSLAVSCRYRNSILLDHRDGPSNQPESTQTQKNQEVQQAPSLFQQIVTVAQVVWNGCLNHIYLLTFLYGASF